MNVIHAFPLMLLRGTPLYDNKAEFGLVESTDIASDCIPRVQDNVIPHVVSSNTFTYSDWKKMSMLAEWLEIHYGNCSELGEVETVLGLASRQAVPAAST